MGRSAAMFVQMTALTAAAVALAGCDITIGASEYSVREEKKFAVNGQAQLALSTFDGSIEVRGWDRDEVTVEVEKVGPDQRTVDRIQVKAAQDGNAITIDVQKPSPLESTAMRRSPGANLIVSVPVKTSVVARSGDGSIEIRRVSGKLDLDTEDGGILVEEITGAVAIRTGDGRVSGSKVNGPVEIHTGDGTVSLDGVLTGLTIETRDGTVEVTARPGSRTDAAWEVTTGDGDVRIEVPQEFGAEVDARTGDGRVRVDSITDTADAKKDEREDRDSAAGRLGGGGKALRIRTSSGSITVKRW